MVLIIENQGSQRCVLEGSTVEAFTQKAFSELISDCHSRQCDYYLARVICTGTTRGPDHEDKKTRKSYYCYDARQLCKYVFEMVISAEGRKVQIKNFKDPINQRTISELYFFRLRHDSETPMRAEYAGCHRDFLESLSFRSKVFNQEDAMDALSVNFKQNKTPKIPFLTRRQILSVFMIVLFVLLLTTLLVITVEKRKHYVSPVQSYEHKVDKKK